MPTKIEVSKQGATGVVFGSNMPIDDEGSGDMPGESGLRGLDWES
jgi:hypothetical protein